MVKNASKIILYEKDMPTKWYNILPDLPTTLPMPLNPETGKPVQPEDLKPIFPENLIRQEFSQERWIDIPEQVLHLYHLYRPSPMYRAFKLEKYLNTPARIYYKYEGVSPAGSHKPNTAIAQAYYNKQAGIKRLATETGAGQWGSALAFSGRLVGIEVTVYMVKCSFEQKPYRKFMIEAWGSEIFASPSKQTNFGRQILEKYPDTAGSLGIAISEAVEDAASHDDTNYALGSVLNHVLLHQTIIGEECMKQMEIVDDYPDIVIGCVGGGSNFGGIAIPYAREKIKGEKETKIIGVEPSACPTLTKGKYCYDFGDTAKMTPLLLMHTLGHSFIPPAIHAGGLRYHGMAPIVSYLVDKGIAEARSYHQLEVFKSAIEFAKTEGIIPAPESAHAIKAAVDEALKAKEEGKEKTILFNLSGHGNFDLASYNKYLTEGLDNYEYPEEEIEKALKEVEEYNS